MYNVASNLHRGLDPEFETPQVIKLNPCLFPLGVKSVSGFTVGFLTV